MTIDDYGFLLSVQAFQSMTAEEWRPLFRRAGAEEATQAWIQRAPKCGMRGHAIVGSL